MSSVHRDNIFQFFEWALPSPQTFNQELDVWKQMWHDVVDDAPDTLQTSLAACEQKLFPNIFLCLYLLMVVPVSTAATEHSHSGLQIVKTKLQSTMGQQRLNALMLIYIHKENTDKLSKDYWHLCKQIPKKDVVQKSIGWRTRRKTEINVEKLN